MNLLDYVKHSTTPHHAVAEGMSFLREAGFTELSLQNETFSHSSQNNFELEKGEGYFLPVYGTTLIAFTIGRELSKKPTMHIAAAHTDHPCLHIKPKAELSSDKYLKINVEVYGGPILNTWLDRPLSIAGKVALKGKDAYHPVTELVDFKRPLAIIPNLAIHMNRKVNEGIELNKQTDLSPIIGSLTESINKNNYFIELLAKELSVKVDDILDFDLYVYCKEDGCYLGIEEEFISAPRLDNLTSCHALLCGIADSSREKDINVAVLYDHEEIGSRSKQGADSSLLSLVLEKIYYALGYDRRTLIDSIFESFLMSVDVAHALHPNRAEKYDPVNQAYLNEGIVLKINSNQKYTFDTEAIAIAQGICEENLVPYQKYANRSDMAGGGTLGPIISGWLPMKTVDIGVPILAMHSAREIMGRKDQDALVTLMKGFYC